MLTCVKYSHLLHFTTFWGRHFLIFSGLDFQKKNKNKEEKILLNIDDP